jgi:ABC-2 type transport system ATP-binding protein
MSVLTSRFREVTVTLGQAEPLREGQTNGLPHKGKTSAKIPFDSWLLPESGPSVYRFIHSQCDTEPLHDQIAAVLPNATDVQAEPMTLRAIFLALAKSGRAPAVSSNAPQLDRSRS